MQSINSRFGNLVGYRNVKKLFEAGKCSLLGMLRTVHDFQDFQLLPFMLYIYYCISAVKKNEIASQFTLILHCLIQRRKLTQYVICGRCIVRILKKVKKSKKKKKSVLPSIIKIMF